MAVKSSSMFQIAFRAKMDKKSINLKKRNFNLIRKLLKEDLHPL